MTICLVVGAHNRRDIVASACFARNTPIISRETIPTLQKSICVEVISAIFRNSCTAVKLIAPHGGLDFTSMINQQRDTALTDASLFMKCFIDYPSLVTFVTVI